MLTAEEKIISTKRGNILIHRDTPWDTRSFGFRTNEIMSLQQCDLSELRELLGMYIEYVSENNVLLSYSRMRADRIEMRRIFQEYGFYYAETSVELRLTKLDKYENKGHTKNSLHLEVLSEEKDIVQVKEIAARAFKHSRFHDDDCIGLDLARRRYFNWIDDLIAQNAQIVVYKTEGVVHGFMAMFVHEGRARLILGGSDSGKGYLSPYLWASVLAKLKLQGVRVVTGLISAANIPIFNMYISLGFTVAGVYNGFHRFQE